MGIVFAFFISKTASQAYIIKGIIFSFAIDFIFRTLVVFFRIPILSNSYTSLGMLSNKLAVFLWGGLIGLIFKWLSPPKKEY